MQEVTGSRYRIGKEAITADTPPDIHRSGGHRPLLGCGGDGHMEIPDHGFRWPDSHQVLVRSRVASNQRNRKSVGVNSRVLRRKYIRATQRRHDDGDDGRD